jgi:DNA-binding transcriptional ArsR family regulator
VSTSSPSLLPLFRSEHQARLLAEIFFGQSASGSELSRRTGIPQPSVAREVARLEGAGLVVVEKSTGGNRIKPNMALPYAEPLRQLLAYVSGVPYLVRAEYESVRGVDEVFIHGSWAARFRGEKGSPPNDLDLVVVSNIHSRFTLAEHRASLEQSTGLVVDQLVLPTNHERLPMLRKNAVTVIESAKDLPT